ncbi:MAG: hypothetical protein K1X67_21485 [Fimbriimonadaceae bacterium]|nr:hypothetical protein [Fimbriimonadaceae bacterium]
MKLTTGDRLQIVALGFLGAAVFSVVTHAVPAVAQMTKGLVQLQMSSPGTPQSGHVNVSGTVIGGQFQGSGVTLTNLNASSLAQGTVADARLSPNVATLSGAQSFNGVKTFGGGFVLPSGAAPGKVMTSDGAGNATWQNATGFTLPYVGSINTPAAAIDVTNQSTQIYSSAITARTNAPTGYALIAKSTNASANQAAIQGECAGDLGAGILGIGYSTTGANFGAWFGTASPNGAGVHAENLASTSKAELAGPKGGAWTNGHYKKTFTGGSNVNITPIAFGTVDGTGAILSAGSGNWTSVLSGPGTFEISVNGEPLAAETTQFIATSQSGLGDYSINCRFSFGNALVYVRDTYDHAYANGKFMFVIYKAQPSESN